MGCKPTLTPQQIHHAQQQIAQGQTVKEVAALLNVHRMTIDRALADCALLIRTYDACKASIFRV